MLFDSRSVVVKKLFDTAVTFPTMLVVDCVSGSVVVEDTALCFVVDEGKVKFNAEAVVVTISLVIVTFSISVEDNSVEL